jgi:hypothetical protein
VQFNCTHNDSYPFEKNMKKTIIKRLSVAVVLLLMLTTAACKSDSYPNPYPNETSSQPTATVAVATATVFVMPASEDAVPRISIEDAKAAFDARTAVFIDVRGTENYNLVHIAGALDIPSDQFATRLSNYDRNTLIITYCT